MRQSPHKTQYDTVAKTLHWVMAAGILGMLAFGWWMDGQPPSPRLVELYNLHKSIGILLLVLAVVRLAWRAGHPAPELPDTMAPWEKAVSHATHHVLYLLIFVHPLAGLVGSMASEFPTVFFGVVLPDPLGTLKGLKEFMLAMHGLSAWLFAGLIALHVAAALRHQFIKRDGVLSRMLPGA